jgi:hypothetical protein
MLAKGKEFTLMSSWHPLEIPDSFVVRSNKLLSTRGNGEAKFYIGSNDDPLLRKFFGEAPFKIQAFMRRSDLISYMDSIKSDYLSASKTHRGGSTLSQLWKERRASLLATKSEFIWFNASEQKVGGRRRYIKGIGNYELIRSLPLPLNTKICIDKYIANDGDAIFDFRFLVDVNTPVDPSDPGDDIDFFSRERIEQLVLSQIRSDETITVTERESLVNSRLGQGVFREELLVDCGSKCPISQITDARILRASHIKPWRFASNSDRLDPKNGLILSPTYDLLFDQGLITFEANKTIQVSSQLSDETVRKLGLIDGATFRDLPLSPVENSKRLEFLKYHRETIFLP